jgi:hypothetical protein
VVTVEASLTIAGVDFAELQPAQKTGISDSIRFSVADELAGVTPQDVNVTLTAGSVKATIVITVAGDAGEADAIVAQAATVDSTLKAQEAQLITTIIDDINSTVAGLPSADFSIAAIASVVIQDSPTSAPVAAPTAGAPTAAAPTAGGNSTPTAPTAPAPTPNTISGSTQSGTAVAIMAAGGFVFLRQLNVA